jgi:hypothetical protein
MDYKVVYNIGETVQVMAKVEKYGTSRGYVTGIFNDHILINIDGNDVKFRYDEIYKV